MSALRAVALDFDGVILESTGIKAEAYRALYQEHAGLIYWQFTGLENGVYTSYPGHGGYPPEFDHRVRDWYVEAKQSGGLTWIGPYLGVSS
ncbi:MAG: hypothetical protein IIA41_07180, partial [SAR324 cluster bacterium]|nr:hypothetical protein [SAR324 cluster bacterium]